MDGTDRHAHDERDYENVPGPPHEDHLNIRAISWFLVALLLGSVIILFGLWFLFDVFKKREEARTPERPLRVNVDARRLPPEPRLQPAPAGDMQDLRRAENEVLNGYGWVDPNKGVVRVPVERAIDLLVQRGLAAQSQPRAARTDLPSKTAEGLTLPAESGLGAVVPAPGAPAARLPEEPRGARSEERKDGQKTK